MLCLVWFLYVLSDLTVGQPNIIFILADDYGYHDIGYHGSEIRTPNLDQLAAEGVKLENYYVQPICTPTRSQLLSGRYQIHTGLQHGVIGPSIPNALPADSLTLADKLKDAGYSTHCVGKWHLGFYQKKFLPTRRGFDTFYGFLVGAKSHYSHRRCHARMCGLDWRDNERPSRQQNGYSTTVFSDRVIDIITNHQRRKPFFIYLPYQAVHSPLQAPKEYIRPYRNTISNIRRRKYAGMVAAMDEGVGNITRTLKANGLWDNTLVIFSTDNGGIDVFGGNNYPLRGSKGGLFEGGIRGVGFVTGGFIRNGGRISQQLIHVSDWFPTLVNLARGNYRGVKPLDGVDQWPTINHDSAGLNCSRLYNAWIVKPTTRNQNTLHNWAVLIYNGDDVWQRCNQPTKEDIILNQQRESDVDSKSIINQQRESDVDYYSILNQQRESDVDSQTFKRIIRMFGFDRNNNRPSARDVLLHNIDPLARRRGKRLYKDTFDTRIRAAIRFREYKLLTGNAGSRSYHQHPVFGGHPVRHIIREQPDKNVWLFNIEQDPLESNDLSDTRPLLVRRMLNMLAEFQKTAIKARSPRPDRRADPQRQTGKNRGFWGPWL